jgi:hypothetical protein
MTFAEAVSAVINESNRPYAITYARAVPQAIAEATAMGMQPNDGVRMQIPYILSNLSHWRGDRAREVKKALKEHHERLKKEKK